MAGYDHPDHSNKSSVGDSIGFEDLLIENLDTFAKQEAFNQQDAHIEKVKVPLHKAPPTALEYPNLVVTNITPIHGTFDNFG